jgi:hypothetical protein
LKKAEEDKKKLQDELNSVKGQVKTGQDKYTLPPDKITPTFYKEQLDKVIEKHNHFVELRKQGKQPLVDEVMSGFSELVNLQAKIDPTAGMDDEARSLIKSKRLLDRAGADIVTPRLRKE